MDPLLQHAVPGVAVRVPQALLLARRPFAKQDSCRVVAKEISGQGLFEGAPEEHGGPGILLLPAVEVAMSVAARAGQVVADLGVAVSHRVASELFGLGAGSADSSSHWLARAKPSKFSRDVP